MVITDALEGFRSFALTYTVRKCYQTRYLMTQFIDLSVTRPQWVNLQNLGSRPMLDPLQLQISCYLMVLSQQPIVLKIKLFVVIHYCDIIMGTMASQITTLTIVYSIIYSSADQRKHQSSASLAFVRGIHRWPVNFLHKGPVTRKMFPFDDVITNDFKWCFVNQEFFSIVNDISQDLVARWKLPSNL